MMQDLIPLASTLDEPVQGPWLVCEYTWCGENEEIKFDGLEVKMVTFWEMPLPHIRLRHQKESIISRSLLLAIKLMQAK